MPELSLLVVFIPTFFLVSLTPGLCMTLAMTLGMTVGIRRTLWMMAGEMLGVALVAVAAVLGVAAMMLHYPAVFQLFKWLGAGYLFYLGVAMWRAQGQLEAGRQPLTPPNNLSLLLQGLITAIANPKGWAFMISLLPPFLTVSKPLSTQLTVLVSIIMCSEFVCMLAYATGGRTLRRYLNQGNHLHWLNRVAGGLLILVGIWLLLG